MTGKGTVGPSDADMTNWPEGWDRDGAPAGPSPRPAAKPTRTSSPRGSSSARLCRPAAATAASTAPEAEPARTAPIPLLHRRVDVRRTSRHRLVAGVADGGCAAPCSCWCSSSRCSSAWCSSSTPASRRSTPCRTTPAARLPHRGRTGCSSARTAAKGCPASRSSSCTSGVRPDVAPTRSSCCTSRAPVPRRW